jgi:hypothetical protein
MSRRIGSVEPFSFGRAEELGKGLQCAAHRKKMMHLTIGGAVSRALEAPG